MTDRRWLEKNGFDVEGMNDAEVKRLRKAVYAWFSAEGKFLSVKARIARAVEARRGKA